MHYSYLSPVNDRKVVLMEVIERLFFHLECSMYCIVLY